ncbi:hypothetical protein ALC62_15258, partial [Cyphomyrmex costatus]
VLSKYAWSFPLKTKSGSDTYLYMKPSILLFMFELEQCVVSCVFRFMSLYK